MGRGREVFPGDRYQGWERGSGMRAGWVLFSSVSDRMGAPQQVWRRAGVFVNGAGNSLSENTESALLFWSQILQMLYLEAELHLWRPT